MTVHELLIQHLDRSARQVSICIDGLDEAQFDVRPLPVMMTAREIIEHLCECYTAYSKYVRKEEHNWGEYAAPDPSVAGLRQTLTALQLEGKKLALGTSDDTALSHAFDYMSNHDSYHIGQLAIIRMHIDPEWNSYSLYSENDGN